jgi:hypothetical protein
MHDVTYPIDRFGVPASDNVTYKQPRAFGRPLRINIDDQNATSAVRRWGTILAAFTPKRA